MKIHHQHHFLDTFIIMSNAFPVLDHEFDAEGEMPNELSLLDHQEGGARLDAVFYEDEPDVMD